MNHIKTLFTPKQIDITIKRLALELIENHGDFQNSAIIGLQPRGILLAKRIFQEVTKFTNNPNILFGELDATFYRDDFRKSSTILVPNRTNIEFIVENKKVILVDDVLFTGRTVRAGLDALLDFGRPELVELLVLIDRRYTRHLPIAAKYVGKTVDSINSQKVKVLLKEIEGEDNIYLYTPENK